MQQGQLEGGIGLLAATEGRKFSIGVMPAHHVPNSPPARPLHGLLMTLSSSLENL